MSDFSEKFAALSPSQRELLARRLEMRKAGAARPASQAATPAAEPRGAVEAAGLTHPAGGMQFSIFFFSDDGSKTTGDKYRLLVESAKFADRNGFTAVWTPERHFQDFGGLYPNPSVLSAALSMVTERIGIRAGSVVLPLHSPIRVAEEWAVVDNLSGGRVGVSVASGWHPDDFAISPQSYQNRRELMFANVELVQKLWAGEAVRFPSAEGREAEVRILPRPLQAKLPVWVTSSGSADTWARAGRIGANVLSGLKGDPSQDLAAKVRLYREALASHGHDPRAGCVTVMLHTYLGEDADAVREKVRRPLTDYLRTFMAQGEHLDEKDIGVRTGSITEQDKEALASFAFERFFNTGSLIGTPEKCAVMVERLRQAGVNEIACLVDFGLDAASVLEGLRYLKELMAGAEKF